MADARLARSLASVLAVVELGILVGPPPLRVPAGLILGLILPGVVIAPLLAWPRMEGIEKLLFVPGMSVAIAIITGVVMSVAHLRLTMDSWAVALGLVTAAGLAIAAMRGRNGQSRMELAADSVPALSRASSNGHRRVPGVAFVAMLFIAALAVVGALVIGIAGEGYRGPGFTELWALPGRSPLSAVRIGVVSHELHDARYRLLVSVDGREVRAEDVTLKPGQRWQSAQPVTKAREQVVVWLEKRPSATIYRQVDITGGLNG